MKTVFILFVIAATSCAENIFAQYPNVTKCEPSDACKQEYDTCMFHSDPFDFPYTYACYCARDFATCVAKYQGVECINQQIEDMCGGNQSSDLVIAVFIVGSVFACFVF